MPDLGPSFNVPPGACGATLISSARRMPDMQLQAAEAPLRQYLQMLDRLGIERGVLVQPENTTDNRLLVRLFATIVSGFAASRLSL